jgi:diphthamide biosynthesis protein 3
MSIYEEVEIEDLDYDPIELLYTYPCPCGDKFRITLEDLWDGEDIAPCPSCTLRIMIIYDEEDLPPLPESDDDSDEGEEEKNDDIKDEEEKLESLADALERRLKVE